MMIHKQTPAALSCIDATYHIVSVCKTNFNSKKRQAAAILSSADKCKQQLQAAAWGMPALSCICPIGCAPMTMRFVLFPNVTIFYYFVLKELD